MDIFLLRHSESESNSKGVLSSFSDDPLTKNGQKQAREIVEVLSHLGIESILCSPFPRALETIIPFSKVSGLRVETHECLAEGQLVLDSSVKSQVPEYSKSNGYPIQNETVGQFVGRAKLAAELILSQAEQTILVVSHGHMIRELLNIFLKTNEKVRFPHSNCGLSRISAGKHFTIQYLNRDISSNTALQWASH